MPSNPATPSIRIALWSTSYFKGFGGTERVVTDLANSLSELGLATFVVGDTPDPRQPRPSHLAGLDARVNVYRDTFSNPLLNGKNPLVFLSRTYAYVRASLRLRHFFKTNRIDVVHLHLVNLDVLVLAFYKRIFKFRLVITFTGMEVELAQASLVSRYKIGRALRAADRATAVSREICQRIRSSFRGADVIHIQNGLDVKATRGVASQQLHHLDHIEDDNFVYCGRITKVKRVPLLVATFGDCVRQGCNKKLYVVGDGDEMDEVIQEIEDGRLRNHVIVLGALPHEQTLGVMAKSRCFVMNSSSEGCPLVALETMALGRPVIAPDVGGLGDIIRTGQNGFLYPPRDMARLRELILMVAENERVVQQAGSHATETIEERFDYQDVLRSYVDVYQCGQGDAFHRPPANLPAGRLDAIKRGCEQVLQYRGLSADRPLEGIGVDALIRLFHFDAVEHTVLATEDSPDVVLDQMQLKHLVDGRELTLYNRLVIKSLGEKTDAGPPCPYCGQPLRTAFAKQCRHCGTDWHDPENVVCRKKSKDLNSNRHD